jgi:subtilisin family serine protease
VTRLLTRLLLLGLAALLLVPATAFAARNPAGRYIVVLKESAGDPGTVSADQGRRHGLQRSLLYRHALRGYAAKIPAGRVAALRADPRVAYVEPDGLVSADTTQTGATWGLDRIDQRPLPLNGTFNYTATGTGVRAYIIDSGIRPSHSDFGGRASVGTDTVEPGYNTGGIDCNGHGTHVAGTTGGTTYGVAKGVSLVAVRVLDCGGFGYNSEVIAGVDWVTANGVRPAVVNMSLGGGASTALDSAVRRSIASGIQYAIAGGNGNRRGVAQDACKSSPSRVIEAMTIGATDRTDRKASWSNYGNCVDWFAPGVEVTSAWYSSDTATHVGSGTSMATPHSAGVAALYLQTNAAADPATVRNALYNSATRGIVTSSKTANNHLLFTSY